MDLAPRAGQRLRSGWVEMFTGCEVELAVIAKIQGAAMMLSIRILRILVE
jgi:hypothetical protein